MVFQHEEIYNEIGKIAIRRNQEEDLNGISYVHIALRQDSKVFLFSL